MSRTLYMGWRALEEYTQLQSIQATYERLVSSNVSDYPELTKQFPDRITLAVHAISVLAGTVQQSLDFDGSKALGTYMAGGPCHALLLAPFFVAQECSNTAIQTAVQRYVDTWLTLANVSCTSQKKAQAALTDLFGECLLVGFLSNLEENHDH